MSNLTSGKKSRRYRTERIVSYLKHVKPTQPDDATQSSDKSEMERIDNAEQLPQHKEVYTQSVVPTSNKFTSTARYLSADAQNQTNFDASRECHTPEHRVFLQFDNFIAFTQQLHAHRQMDKFVHLVNAITCGDLSTQN